MTTSGVRFADGEWQVSTAEFGGTRGVVLRMTGNVAGLLPDQARELAATLLEAAETAERPTVVRRRTDVDETLRRLEP